MAKKENVLELAPDPYDPKRFAAKDTAELGFGVAKVMVMLPVRKPGKQEFFRTNPEFSLTAAVLELKDERELYLVLPDVAAQMPGECTFRNLMLCVSRQGNHFLWPVPVPASDGRENPWHHSARAGADLARHTWIRMIPNQAAGMYDIAEARDCVAEPAWPDKAMPELLRLAFGGGKLIEDFDHPVVKRLQGRG
jgi:hypothetical protein